MSTDYTPREGTIAARAIAHLKTLPAGTQVSTADLAVAVGVSTSNLRPSLGPAIKFGAVVRNGEGRRMYYELAAAAEEADPDAPLEINHDSTGDLWFTGHRETTGGGALLSRKQLQQLVAYATTAPVRLQVEQQP